MRAWLGLGSNQDDPAARLREALALLGEVEGVDLLRVSSFYRTPPWGDADQDDFVNAVVLVEARLAPLDLLAAATAIEYRMGRRRSGRRWGPRVIDIDVLLYGDGRYDDAGLEIPHPRMHERAFVLAPLAELDANLSIPGRGRVGELLKALDLAGISKLEDGQSG